MVAPSSILESSTDAPDDRQLKNLKFQTPLATTKNGFPDTLLEEALLKLCTNSAEAIGPAGTGRIHISAGILRDSSEERIQDIVQIQVLDSGPGMDATIRERAFEPFFTTKDSERAFGLGMAIAYGLVEEMGGTIQISDTIPSGSQINIHFPLRSTPQELSGGPVDSSEQTPPRQLHIAMVDNELSIRNVTGGMLKFLGHQANLFADGAKFLEQVQEGQRFDLVLMDNVMPGMTGRSTYERLRVIDSDVPVIICSGRALDLKNFSVPTTRQPDAFLAKPFSISDLATAIAPFA